MTKSFENHGAYRRCETSVDDDVWTFLGDTERARVQFVEGGRKQIIEWEWKPEGVWLPLCDRTAVRTR